MQPLSLKCVHIPVTNQGGLRQTISVRHIFETQLKNEVDTPMLSVLQKCSPTITNDILCFTMLI